MTDNPHTVNFTIKRDISPPSEATEQPKPMETIVVNDPVTIVVNDPVIVPMTEFKCDCCAPNKTKSKP